MVSDLSGIQHLPKKLHPFTYVRHDIDCHRKRPIRHDRRAEIKLERGEVYRHRALVVVLESFMANLSAALACLLDDASEAIIVRPLPPTDESAT